MPLPRIARTARAVAAGSAVVGLAVAILASCAEPGGSADVVGQPATTGSSTVAPSTTPPSTTPSTTATSGEQLRVVGVVDGDTLDVSNGERVRLIGIDTPEIGQCGYGPATTALRELVGGRAVTLVPGARDDRDRYGRLLRYVEVDGVDANLEMLRAGRAIARYDSRDGYGRHTREDAYVAADDASPTANVCSGGPAADGGGAPTTVAGPAGADPRYGSCGDAAADGRGPYVAGRDPEYEWYDDRDGDGVVCE